MTYKAFHIFALFLHKDSKILWIKIPKIKKVQIFETRRYHWGLAFLNFWKFSRLHKLLFCERRVRIFLNCRWHLSSRIFWVFCAQNRPDKTNLWSRAKFQVQILVKFLKRSQKSPFSRSLNVQSLFSQI